MSNVPYTVKYDSIIWPGLKAWKFLIGDEEVWLPLSLISVYEEDKIVEMPEWLLIEKGLEAYSDDYPG